MYEILNHRLLKLPVCEYEGSFRRDIKIRLSNYLTYIKHRKKEYTSLKELDIKIIKNVNLSIFKAVEEYLDGYPAKAFKTINDILDKYSYYFKTELSNSMEKKLLFRMRVGDNYPYKKKDLFHIPYTKRHIISSQRYSIAGFPSLYLGSTIFVCWDELGRPNLSKTHISRYSIKDPINILDFCKFPSDILIDYSSSNEFTRDKDSIIPYLYIWPIIAVSSYKVKYSDAPFKPEYIVPQLILQAIRKNEKYDGIRYFSVKDSLGKIDTTFIQSSKYATNYVFPAEVYSKTGYCEKLIDLFRVSKPIQWDNVLLQKYELEKENSLYKELVEKNRNMNFNSSIHKSKKYESTKFGLVESYIVNEIPLEELRL